MDPAVISQAAARLRQAHGALASLSQAEVVALLAEFGRRWRDPSDPMRRVAERIMRPFPFEMTRVSLDALLDSLTPESLWRLIDDEGVRGASGPPLIGHVIAGNTPLLAWTSLLRALLMRSASLVKLPSGDAAGWGRMFHASLADTAPVLASTIALLEWPGGTAACAQALCENVDLVLAYGSDGTLAALRELCPPAAPLLGYGHRVSFGLLLLGADEAAAAHGFATDILLYDQGGCLSPQTIFVEGDGRRAQAFAMSLAAALPVAAQTYPLSHRAPEAARRVREARLLARMDADTQVWEDPGLRWTVIARPAEVFSPSPTHGVVSVQSLASPASLSAALVSLEDHLQGCAVTPALPAAWAGGLSKKVSYVCAPGRLQAPPLSWPQDGRHVLRSLLGGEGFRPHDFWERDADMACLLDRTPVPQPY